MSESYKKRAHATFRIGTGSLKVLLDYATPAGNFILLRAKVQLFSMLQSPYKMGAHVSRTDFEWKTTDEPHASRRKEILGKFSSL